MKTLMKHQEVGVDLMVANATGFANHCEQGTGKTAMAIVAATRLSVRKVLVVCPATLKFNWKKEWAEWTETEWDIVVIGGTPAQRAKQFAAAMKTVTQVILIMNYDILEKSLDQLLKFHPDLIISDECHSIKNHKSRRAKSLKLIPTKYKFGLTGTPQTNTPLDHFSQFDWLRPQYLGVNFYVFRATYADVYTGGGFPMIKSYRNLNDLQKKIAKYSYRVTKEQCLDLPERTFQTIPIELSDKSRKIYDALAEEYIAEVGDNEVLADTTLVRLLRFQQITSGFVGVEGPPKSITPLADEKLDALRDLAETLENEKIVVWTKFRYDMARVKELLEKMGRRVFSIAGEVTPEDRHNAVQEFEQPNGRNDAIVCNIQAGATGITLVQSCYAIYYSRNFSLGDHLQSCDRVHRKGQTRKVTYYDLVCEETIDEHIIKTLYKKKQIAAKVNGDELRMMLKGQG